MEQLKISQVLIGDFVTFKYEIFNFSELKEHESNKDTLEKIFFYLKNNKINDSQQLYMTKLKNKYLYFSKKENKLILFVCFLNLSLFEANSYIIKIYEKINKNEQNEEINSEELEKLVIELEKHYSQKLKILNFKNLNFKKNLNDTHYTQFNNEKEIKNNNNVIDVIDINNDIIETCANHCDILNQIKDSEDVKILNNSKSFKFENFKNFKKVILTLLVIILALLLISPFLIFNF